MWLRQYQAVENCSVVIGNFVMIIDIVTKYLMMLSTTVISLCGGYDALKLFVE